MEVEPGGQIPSGGGERGAGRASHIGSSFEDWLREEGLFEECNKEARKSVAVFQKKTKEQEQKKKNGRP